MVYGGGSRYFLEGYCREGGEWWLFLGERIGFQSNLYLKEKSNDTKV
jgi:hypothetical protein